MILQDYYPSKAGSFVSTMQTFHDAHPDVKFAIGETGLSQTASMEARLAYVEEITSEATMQALPNFIGCTWCECSPHPCASTLSRRHS